MPKRSQHEMPIQLPYLETFCEVAEKRSFTAAGKNLGMTQAAVSQRIHALEKMLGRSLFLRKGTQIRITESGQQLYGYAQEILRVHREAYAAISGQRTAIRGDLSVAASSVPGESFLPDLLVKFREKYPQIRVRAAIFDSLAAIREVERGNADVGLVGKKLDSAKLEFRPFASDEMVLVVSSKHPWSGRRTVAFNSFARQPLILREQGSGSRSCFEEALATLGKRIGQLNVVLELSSNEAIKKAVSKGIGVAVLSFLAVKNESQRGELHAIRIKGLDLTRTMYVVLNTQRALPLPARTFLQVVQAIADG